VFEYSHIFGGFKNRRQNRKPQTVDCRLQTGGKIAIAVLRNVDPQSFLYRPRQARSVLLRPPANIPATVRSKKNQEEDLDPLPDFFAGRVRMYTVRKSRHVAQGV